MSSLWTEDIPREMESEPSSGRGEVGSPGGQEERAGGGGRLYGSLTTLLSL